MTDETRKKWINAAIKLGKDKSDKIACPSCNTGVLQIIDVPFGSEQTDRHIFCESCGERGVMTGNFPDSEFYFKDNMP
jgi:DNA-directed RNA polymerase subunit RPC12/RpoP